MVIAEDGRRSISIEPIHNWTIEPRRDEWSSDGIDAIAWSPDGKTIVAAAFDKLAIWNTKVRLFGLGMCAASTNQADWQSDINRRELAP